MHFVKSGFLGGRDVPAGILSAICELKAWHGPVDRAAAEISSEIYRTRFMNQYRVTLSQGRTCPHRLVGKRGCLTFCFPGQDHAELWMRNGKPVLWTSQPYGLDAEQLANALIFCKSNGLDMEISAGSWHFPGSTLLVMVGKREVLCGFDRNDTGVVSNAKKVIP